MATRALPCAPITSLLQNFPSVDESHLHDSAGTAPIAPGLSGGLRLMRRTSHSHARSFGTLGGRHCLVCHVVRMMYAPRLWADKCFSRSIATGHSLEHPASNAQPELGDYVEAPQP